MVFILKCVLTSVILLSGVVSNRWQRGPRPRQPLNLDPAPTDYTQCDIIEEDRMNYIVDNRVTQTRARHIREFISEVDEYVNQYQQVYSPHQYKLGQLNLFGKGSMRYYNLNETISIESVTGQKWDTTGDLTFQIINGNKNRKIFEDLYFHISAIEKYLRENTNRLEQQDEIGTFFVFAKFEIRVGCKLFLTLSVVKFKINEISIFQSNHTNTLQQWIPV